MYHDFIVENSVKLKGYLRKNLHKAGLKYWF